MKIIFSFICILISVSNYSQIAYQGTILNKDKQPISGVTIVSADNPSNGTISNNNGKFNISLGADTTVNISSLGYKPMQIVLNTESNVITLSENSEVLNEVIVSANREVQTRQEIPNAISTISSSTIQNTKAMGIEQLVNQSSGVFMSSSPMSNEQHMMAVRSPITTMALFLYLEDGLPIRPSAAFNHNALLEMNQTAFQRIEILNGPSSSIYGSDAIGGSFNFITKNPTNNLSSSIGFEINDFGLTRYELEVADYTNDDFGFYLGSHYVERNDGPIAHSDYDKFALTFKTVLHIDPSTNWINVFDLINYRSDTTGDLTIEDYENGNYESDQTFTDRNARSFRYRSSLSKNWSEKQKTTANFIFRDNTLGQIPSYRIKQFMENGALTGSGVGEINSEQFNSLVGLVQHNIKMDFKESSLIIGASIDYTQQNYVANSTSVVVDTQTGQNIDYEANSNDFILNYKANISNYAGYLQYEISPIEALKITTAIRFDQFKYDYNNLIDDLAGAKDTKSSYEHFAPKFGMNYNISDRLGFYAGYSNGFTPPQASDLYRNNFTEIGGNIFDLKPSTYHNYELGGYYQPNKALQLDFSLYLLNGKNTMVSLRDKDDAYYNTNIGSTRSVGLEYKIKYQISEDLSIVHNGSFASHRYLEFFDQGVDYSHTTMEIAPKLLGQSLLNYSPKYFKGFSLGLEHELVGKYNTSFEGQAINNDGSASTFKYDGHQIFNLRAVYRSSKIELWGHFLNIFDTLYAVRASYNQFRNENSYSVGSPRGVHFGIKYHF